MKKEQFTFENDKRNQHIKVLQQVDFGPEVFASFLMIMLPVMFIAQGSTLWSLLWLVPSTLLFYFVPYKESKKIEEKVDQYISEKKEEDELKIKVFNGWKLVKPL